jgi:hypothetical protein
MPRFVVVEHYAADQLNGVVLVWRGRPIMGRMTPSSGLWQQLRPQATQQPTETHLVALGVQ